MKQNLTLEQRVEINRKNLKKQDTWARSVEKCEFMENVVIEEHSYGNGEREKLDFIYSKAQGDEKLPVFFYIHGGGWISGDKNSRRNYCGKFAESRYVVVNIEYDVAPEAKFPVAIGQCIVAIDYALDHTEEYHMDKERIAVGGESAGVYYAMFVAEISKDKALLNEFGIPQMRHPEFDVKVNILNCGCVDLKMAAESGFPDVGLMMEAYTGYKLSEITEGKRDRELAAMSPFTYITEDFPNSFLIYGSWDGLRFNTLRLAERLKELQVPHKLYKSTGIFYGQHTTTMILKSKKAFKVFDDIAAYMNQILN